jgi:hypothetical protein
VANTRRTVNTASGLRGASAARAVVLEFKSVLGTSRSSRDVEALLVNVTSILSSRPGTASLRNVKSLARSALGANGASAQSLVAAVCTRACAS